MATYTAIVIETRTVKVRYTVEAESLEEAQELLEAGETEDENELSLSTEVLDRTIWEGPEEV